MVVSPKNPGSHRHWARDDDIGFDRELRGHGLARPNRHHWDVLHGEQAPPFKPWYPGSQTQAWISLEPSGELELAGHGRQLAEEGAATPE